MFARPCNLHGKPYQFVTITFCACSCLQNASATCGSQTYHKLSAPAPDALEVWLFHGRDWLTSIHSFILASLPFELSKAFATFLHSFHFNRLPSFYLLVKSHVRLSIENNRWPSRPLVGLTKWATTGASIILSIFGNIALRVDPTHAPLIDSLDFVSRLRDIASHDHAREYVVTSVDFNSLYTNFVWKDVVDTCQWDFWMKFLLERATHGHLTPYEFGGFLNPWAMTQILILPPVCPFSLLFGTTIAALDTCSSISFGHTIFFMRPVKVSLDSTFVGPWVLMLPPPSPTSPFAFLRERAFLIPLDHAPLSHSFASLTTPSLSIAETISNAFSRCCILLIPLSCLSKWRPWPRRSQSASWM